MSTNIRKHGTTAHWTSSRCNGWFPGEYSVKMGFTRRAAVNLSRGVILSLCVVWSPPSHRQITTKKLSVCSDVPLDIEEINMCAIARNPSIVLSARVSDNSWDSPVSSYFLLELLFFFLSIEVCGAARPDAGVMSFHHSATRAECKFQDTPVQRQQTAQGKCSRTSRGKDSIKDTVTIDGPLSISAANWQVSAALLQCH